MQAKIVRTVAVTMVEEKINGHTFVYRLDVVDGQKKEQWSIDNKRIAQADYDKNILEQEMEERRIEREQAYQKQVKFAEFKSNAYAQTVKKLLSTMVDQIEQGLEQFNRYDLNPYIAYATETIADAVDFTTLAQHTLPEIKQVLETDFDPIVAKEKLDQIQAYPQKLAGLFEGTIQNAINKCDEPKKLKEWLQMLS